MLHISTTVQLNLTLNLNLRQAIIVPKLDTIKGNSCYDYGLFMSYLLIS